MSKSIMLKIIVDFKKFNDAIERLTKAAKGLGVAKIGETQRRLDSMTPRELMLDVAFVEFCAANGLVRKML